LLVYAHDVNLYEHNTDTVKKNTETLIYGTKKVGINVRAENTVHILLSHHQNAWQNHGIKTANRSFENMAQFEYLGT
jgi:hypothetical protein